MFDKTKIADALTTTRWIGAPTVLLPLLVFGYWPLALVVALVLILTDAFDGIAARKWKPERRRYKMDPGQYDENADGVLTNVLLGGVAFHFVFVDGDFSWSYLAKALGVIAAMLVVTGALILATNKLPMPWCKRADIANGFYYGLLLLAALVIIAGNAFGWNSSASAIWVPIFIVAVLVLCYVKRDRLFDRDESKYGDRAQSLA